MMSQMHFDTLRLSVEDWGDILSDPSKRSTLERELKVLLTPKITYRLPLSMQFSVEHDSITKWVDGRSDEAQILCVHALDTEELVGLIILFDNPEETETTTIHLGYILGESNWGKGYATEMIKALVSVLGGGPKLRLAAGVDRDNVASVGVLEKTGFSIMPEQTTAGRYYFELNVG